MPVIPEELRDKPIAKWTADDWRASSATMRRRSRLSAARKRIAAIAAAEPTLTDEEFAELRSLLYPPGSNGNGSHEPADLRELLSGD